MDFKNPSAGLLIKTGMRRRAVLLLTLALGVGDCSPSAPPAAPAAPREDLSAAPISSTSPIGSSAPADGPRPDRGRKPAPTMSHFGAGWLTRPERVEEEQPDRMLDALHIRYGMVVADIGAGVGYHALRLSTRVGAEGRVYATDIQPEMLEKLRKAVRQQGITNVITALSGDTTTGLPQGAIDLALMVDVYHELSEPERFLGALKLALKPDGRLVLVEFRGEDPDVPIKEEHKMTVAQAVRELDAAGFWLIEQAEFLPWQHILIFGRKAR
jgi:protein-L-isoaspartate O-methyltransferase